MTAPFTETRGTLPYIGRTRACLPAPRPASLSLPPSIQIGSLRRYHTLGRILSFEFIPDTGGRPGKPSSNVLNPATEHRVLTAKVTTTIRRGDVFRHDQPGGWGDPLDRDHARVLKDVRNELVSLRSSREDYGVVIDPATWTVDEAATSTLREELRTARGWREVPTVSRE